MRLHILSDLHLEFAPFDIPKTNADVVILAGDVHTGKNGMRWIAENLPKVPVVYVLGNHEFYGQKTPTLIQELKQLAKGTNISLLENDSVEIGDTEFMGATLWTDFRLDGDLVLAETAAVIGMTDFKRIRLAPSYRRLRPSDTRRFHVRTVEWLRSECERFDGRKIVIVTHHAPSARSVPLRFKSDPLNAAFASGLDHAIEQSKAKLWIHGHIHEQADYLVGSTRVIANPRGYPGEQLNRFKSDLVIEI